MSQKEHNIAKFGAVLGFAPGDVAVYSCDYNSASKEDLPDRHSYRNFIGDVYTGYKWQCVEFARRWLFINQGVLFDDIAMAYDIFQLRHYRRVSDGELLPIHSFANGSKRAPEPGCLLIWNEGGEFELTGHVAVVTEVSDTYVRFAEQNMHNEVWPEGQRHSREIRALRNADGGYVLEAAFEDASILGWVIQTDDKTHAVEFPATDSRLFSVLGVETKELSGKKDFSVDLDQPELAAYVKAMGGAKLASEPEDENKYFVISQSAQDELKRATNELHALIMIATDHVLQDEAILAKFNLPKAIWPKLHQSWDNRRNHLITGRFDFRLAAEGIKLYEYNCDSASCHLECGTIQNLWFQHHQCEIGSDPGADLNEKLVKAWRSSHVDGLLHILQDHDDEEDYHALNMRKALHQAGVQTKVITGVEALSWNAAGEIVDQDKEAIRWVWKTWAWETALDQIRDQCTEDALENPGFSRFENGLPPRLVDVLLRPEVMVFEPLWTLIPSNKAILPVLWSLFPEHAYLLESSFELTPHLQESGYVAKPIVGRWGSNIQLYGRGNNLLTETSGQFGNQDQIFQAFAPLPKILDRYVQVCTFTVDGVLGGTCVRTDPSQIIKAKSDVLGLRTVPDQQFLELAKK